MGKLAPFWLHGRCLKHPSVRQSRHVSHVGTVSPPMCGAQERLCTALRQSQDLCPLWQAP